MKQKSTTLLTGSKALAKNSIGKKAKNDPHTRKEFKTLMDELFDMKVDQIERINKLLQTYYNKPEITINVEELSALLSSLECYSYIGDMDTMWDYFHKEIN